MEVGSVQRGPGSPGLGSLRPLAQWNLCVGFFLLWLAGLGGVFLAVTSAAHLRLAPALRGEWLFVLLKSAHGHSALLGLLHSLVGLTMGHSALPRSRDKQLTWGLVAGSLTMMLLMPCRALLGPQTLGQRCLEFLSGLALGAWFLSISAHLWGLWSSYHRGKEASCGVDSGDRTHECRNHNPVR